MTHTEHTIYIHPLAPAKVPEGAPCNGCGVCCLFAPCPLGMVLSRSRTGACKAVRWDGALNLYRCGALVAPQNVLAQSLPRGARWLATALAPALRRLGQRWIAVGAGCDSRLEARGARRAVPGSLRDGAQGSTTMPTFDSHHD